jgi:hypothetical protein
VKSLYDATAYSLDVPLGLATVADVAHPQSANLKQPPNVIAQWLFKMFQIQAQPHAEALCQSDIICTNGTPEGLDPCSQELEPPLQAL